MYAGDCGFKTVVEVVKIDKMKVKVQVISASQDVRKLNEVFAEVDCA